jgi:8-oxo-dGTP pyrophosphatase MutT (NUDIX family)
MVTLNAVRAVLDRPVVRPDAPRHAAVAVILSPALELVFMLRAESSGDPWSGHVSFPGGKLDPGDADPLAAAIRETAEEIGVDLVGAELLGPLDVVAPVSGMIPIAVHPFVFALADQPIIRLNAEVRSVHLLSLDTLLAGTGRGSMDMSFRGHQMVLPCVDFDGLRLWGLTLRMVDDLLDRLDGRGIGLDRVPRGIIIG